ncbi:MAG: FHA domain-containing protein, partial [Ruminiclostridium sp.]|nr:FHA domain-containing protein [Ruminiclostridium sp.]
LTYVNDEIVMETKQLEAWDKITLGDSDFLLIPLCCDRFSWEDYITR